MQYGSRNGDMAFLELILILAGLIAAIIVLASAIRKVTAYYKTKYGFSIWSGVFVVVLAMVFWGLNATHYGESLLLTILGIALLLMTAVQDIRHSGFIMGSAAILFQMLMSICFILIIGFAFIGLIARALTRRTNVLLRIFTGTTYEIRYGVIHFWDFFRFW